MSSKHYRRFVSDKVHWYFNEVTSKVVAKSGIPSDRHHLGKILLQSFKDSPDFVMQIDGAKNESITHRSILQKSVKCATCFKKLGLKKGDVITIMAPNYVDISVPFYACLYLGMIVSPMDMTFNVKELSATFQVNMPRLVFCESEKAPDVQLALNNLELNCQIVTLDKGDYLCSLTEFLEAYGDDINVDDFEPEDFDPEETIAFLIPTSGTTGLPKSAAATHKNFATSGSYMWLMYSQFPTPVKMAFVPSPMQWLTAIMSFVVSPIFRYTRLMSSENVTPELTYQMLSKYKPNYTIMSPTMMTALLKNKEKCDLTCFSTILLGGSAVGEDLMQEIKAMTPSTEVFSAFGMTEVTGLALCTDYPPLGSCGRPMNYLEYRLIDVETQNDIYDAHTPGELWMRGPSLIKEYYNNPIATSEAFAEGRWFKTGDIFYRDENWYFYFVERLKLMLKYKGFQISPVEVENIIRQHPSVLDAAVVGIPDPECGDLVVACVVKKEGGVVSAQEIKDFVKNNLSDPKQLRGGVIFMDNIPMTASTKVHRRKLKEMVLTMEKE